MSVKKISQRILWILCAGALIPLWAEPPAEPVLAPMAAHTETPLDFSNPISEQTQQSLHQSTKAWQFTVGPFATQEEAIEVLKVVQTDTLFSHLQVESDLFFVKVGPLANAKTLEKERQQLLNSYPKLVGDLENWRPHIEGLKEA